MRIAQKNGSFSANEIRGAAGLAKKIMPLTQDDYSCEADFRKAARSLTKGQRPLSSKNVVDELHRQAESLLQDGLITQEGARRLVGLVIASRTTSNESLDLLEGLVDFGDKSGRRVLEGFVKNTPDHIRQRTRRRKVIDFRTSKQVRDYALRDGKLDNAEIKALAEVTVRYPFDAVGDKIMNELFMKVPVNGFSAEDKKAVIKGAIRSWKKSRPEPFQINEADIARMAKVLEIGGYMTADREALRSLVDEVDFAGSAKEKFNAILDKPAIGDPAEWTVFFATYGDADVEWAIHDNINIMEKIGQRPGRVNVVALVDAGDRPHQHMSATDCWEAGTRLLWISKDEQDSDRVVSREIKLDGTTFAELHDRYRGHMDMSNPKVMRSGIEAVKELVPSEHLMVEIIGHGASWRGFDGRTDAPGRTYQGVALDPASGDLETAFGGLGVDFLAYTSCNMATQEVAESARKAGIQYFAASEAIVPCSGWPFPTIMERVDAMFDKDGTVEPAAMAKTVVDAYNEVSTYNKMFSATDLEKFPEAQTAINTFAEALIEAGGLQNPEIRKIYLETPRFHQPQFDVGVFARRIAKQFINRPLAKAARQAITGVKQVCYSRLNENGKNFDGTPYELPARRDRPIGLSIYAPTEVVNKRYDSKNTPWKGGAWLEFIRGVESTPEETLAKDAVIGQTQSLLALRAAG